MITQTILQLDSRLSVCYNNCNTLKGRIAINKLMLRNLREPDYVSNFFKNKLLVREPLPSRK